MSEVETPYEVFRGGLVEVRSWTRGVPFEGSAKVQAYNLSQLPIVHPYVAIMPDVHTGVGCVVGSVIPTIRAIIPETVGVDLGCGMDAVRTDLTSHDLSDNAREIFDAITAAVPHGSNKKSVGEWQSV